MGAVERVQWGGTALTAPKRHVCRAAVSAAPRLWPPMTGRAGPASQRARRRSGTAVATPRLAIMPLQPMIRDHRSSALRCRVVEPHGPTRSGNSCGCRRPSGEDAPLHPAPAHRRAPGAGGRRPRVPHAQRAHVSRSLRRRLPRPGIGPAHAHDLRGLRRRPLPAEFYSDFVVFPLGDTSRPHTRGERVRYLAIEARQLKLHTKLADTLNVTAAQRRRINVQLDNLASEQDRLCDPAA